MHLLTFRSYLPYIVRVFRRCFCIRIDGDNIGLTGYAPLYLSCVTLVFLHTTRLARGRILLAP